MTMFHSHSGLFFERLPDGVVRIIKTYDGRDVRLDNTVMNLQLSASEWASVVAGVSYGSETAESFAAALKFHQFAEPHL
jgi:hypothetical protein